MVEARKPEAAAKAPAPKAAPATPAVPPEPTLNAAQQREAETQKKAKAEAEKVELQVNDKTAKINANLIKDGNPNRIMGQSREGKPKYFWGNFVPTRELTSDELDAVEEVKA
jgi:hypothetical protein